MTSTTNTLSSSWSPNLQNFVVGAVVGITSSALEGGFATLFGSFKSLTNKIAAVGSILGMAT